MDSTAKEDKIKKGKNHYIILENEFTIKEVDDRYFSPKYKLGEVVYLKEPYCDLKCQGVTWLCNVYKYTDPTALSNQPTAKWSNKLFMPQSAARYYIKITSIRAERLQDISEEDCLKEGIQKHLGGYKTNYRQPDAKSYLDGYSWTPQEEYKALIDKINGKGTWESNVWVWVYDFELIKQN